MERAVTMVAEEKRELRVAMRARREALSASDAARASDAACRAALALPGLTSARVVAVYRAIRHELDPLGIERALAAAGVVIALPRVGDARAGGRLSFLRADGPTVASAFGVPEPAPDAPEVALSAIDAFVVPGLAFDARGARLGWGRGHYDVTLAAAPRALRVGFCHQMQLVPVVPESSGDERMDVIVTDAGAFPTGARPRTAAGRSP
jgi:5-formyltetrahydrofolate cyclo-ligase